MFHETDFEKLNEAQRKAVTTISGSLLVLAGAGTGKTKTMVSRAAYMVANGIQPANILMLTFTNKAATEMKSRVINLLKGEAGKEITACTFHSFCVMLLRRYGNLIGIPPHFTIVTGTDEADIIDIVKAEKNEQRFKAKGFPPSAKIVSIISCAINKGISIYEVMESTSFAKYEAFAEEIVEIKDAVADYKLRNHMMNYDDLLLLTLRLFERVPVICRAVAEAHPYIMVDEYQDTNTLQEQILLQLFKHTKNIAVVGDDMQALYGFRGAEVENILEFPKRFPGGTSVALTDNYRSNQEILDLSNLVVQNATEGFKKCLQSSWYSGWKPQLLSVEDTRQEADDIKDNIIRWKKQGVKLNDICVLFRSSLQSVFLEQELMLSHIPYEKRGGKKYFELDYVKDVLSYLRVTVNQHDEIAWFRILQQHRGIGKQYARMIAAECKQHGILALLDKKYQRRKYKDELVLLHRELSVYNTSELSKILPRAIEFYMRVKEENIRTMKTADESRRTELLEALPAMRLALLMLEQIATEYQDIATFLNDVVLEGAGTAGQGSLEEQVVLSTIHSAKGLEFQKVIVMDCVDEVFPSTSILEAGSKEDNEELRCFYVAITRAKEELILYVPEVVFLHGKVLRGALSHFLTDAKDAVSCNDNEVFNICPCPFW